VSFNLGSLSINLSLSPLPVAVNLSQKQRMMSRPTIYDVTPLQLEAAGYVEDLGPDELEEADALAAHCQAQVEARKSARTQLNLAMSKEQLERFTKFANRKHIPPSTLAKAWILERLDQEA